MDGFKHVPERPKPLYNDPEYVVFYLIDMQEEDNTTVLYGVTMEGNSVMAYIKGYEHYFYVGTDKDITEYELQNSLSSKFPKMKELQVVTPSQKLKTIHALNKQPKHIFQVKTNTNSYFMDLKNEMKDYSLYNANIDQKTRFLIDCNAVGCGWVQLSRTKASVKSSNCQINVEGNFRDLRGLDHAHNAPVRILSFDIECISSDGFPKANNEKDMVITIGCCMQEGLHGPQEHVVLQLNDCAPLHNGHVRCFDDEYSLIKAFERLVIKFDPDIITGYNIDNFDFTYLFDRAQYLKIAPLRLSRQKQYACRAERRIFQSNYMGQLESFDIKIPGRVSVDVLPYIKVAYKLRSYTLNNVSAEFLNEQKDDVHYSTIYPLFQKDAHSRRILAQYCLKDSILPMKLINKLMIIVQLFEMAKVTGVTISVLVKQGYQVRMISLLTRYTKEHNMIIPYRAKPTYTDSDGDEELDLEGATVLEPKKGFYGKNYPISTLDFNSLYPSIIIAHNLCYSTLIDKNQIDIEYFNKQYNKAFKTVEDLFNSEMVTRTPTGFYFLKAEYEYGLLPMILQTLLSARKKAKEDMKKAYDLIEVKVLDGRQLALKVTANSLYGFTGAIRTGKLPSIEISYSVTSFGRQMIELTKQQIEEHYKSGKEIVTDEKTIYLKNDAVVVYGDTDSVMIKFGVTFEDSFVIARDAAKLVTKYFTSPINLEFEKVYCPYLLITKKRYAGLFYTRPDKYDKIDVKGLELVRRDNCQLVAITMNGVLERLLVRSSKYEAIDYVKAVVYDLVTEKIDMQLLVISKSFTQPYDKYKTQNQPHLTVVLKKQGRGHTVKVGDRIYYVIIKSPDKEMYKRAEDPQYVIYKGLSIDTDYYLHYQLEKPIARLFKDIIGNGDEETAARKLFSGLHTLYSAPAKTDLPSFIKTIKTKVSYCLSCNNRLESYDSRDLVCSQCMKHKKKLYEKYTRLVREMQLAEHRLCYVSYECCICYDMEDAGAQCSNQDCEVYYARFKQLIEFQRCRAKYKQFYYVKWIK